MLVWYWLSGCLVESFILTDNSTSHKEISQETEVFNQKTNKKLPQNNRKNNKNSTATATINERKKLVKTEHSKTSFHLPSKDRPQTKYVQ